MRVLTTVLLLLLAASAAPFAIHAALRPLEALQGVEEALGRFLHPEDRLGTFAIYAHMLSGAAITVAVPLQLLPVIRRRLPVLHRASGYALTSLAAATALFGLLYIARQGTVGGPWMSAWFALYGLLMLLAAAMVVRCARQRQFDRHRDWALRFLVLAVASYLYRVHYGLWYLATGGLWVADDFTGAFDRANVWAFFLPYLIALELVLIAVRRRQAVSP